MMKRIISVLLVILMLVSFAACKKEEAPNSNEAQQTEQTTKENTIKNRNKTVKIQIPLGAIDEAFQNDLKGYCEKYGYESAKIDKKSDMVTVKMSYFNHRLLLTQMGMEVITGIYKVLEDGTYKYFKDIESYDDKNFSEVTILVNEKAYKKDATSTLLPFTLAQTCFVYQMYTEAGIDKCDIVIKNAKTNKIIETKTYTDENT